MNKEDYSKYYIQGSDHYLLPKDVFNELFQEMTNWKEECKDLNRQKEDLKKWLEEKIQYYKEIGYDNTYLALTMILDKIKELEEGVK